MNRVTPLLWYPALVSAALLSFAILLRLNMPPAIAACLPIASVAALLLVLEAADPANTSWRASGSDLKADAAFMLLVQIALVRLLSLIAVTTLATWTHKHATSRLWPQHWSLAAQIALMVLLIDLVRYWLHRACHSWRPLWRLHEVHHSPEILYTLNVGRFHPLEKTLHFALDSLPFMLLGVAPAVMAGYFLCYSVNGFFQHCNVRLRYGWLNYLVAGAETHRWHHARDANLAGCNFSNTTIVWDLVFGTWFLPKGRSIDALGLADRAYPKAFLSQLASPFRSRKDASAQT
jgi:sterol desaturase/sphingolipid hydroxylase (fatty acid hydroxylase superfamily)